MRIPEEMGEPRADQLQGSSLERLSELAGRVCYDSLGGKRSRDSASYHAHIQEVGHGSVYEHGSRTFEVDYRDVQMEDRALLVFALMNRPGVTVLRSDPIRMRVTINLRAMREWGEIQDRRVRSFPEVTADLEFFAAQLGRAFQAQFALTDPAATPPPSPEAAQMPQFDVLAVDPAHATEVWASVFIQCSRGCSHELVRHGDGTAISQRSTRYVDESDSDWIKHLLISLFELNRATPEKPDPIPLGFGVKHSATQSYATSVSKLQEFLGARGVDKHTARKQARGAARGFLGNALSTQMVFTANMWAWQNILRQRMHPAADAEIRVLASHCYDALQEDERVAAHLAGMEKVPAEDGLGSVLA